MKDLINRLRCRYPIGPIGPDGEPEFGYRDMSGKLEVILPTRIMLEAADAIENLTADHSASIPAPATGDDPTGFQAAPDRYMSTGRETIDRIRDRLGDEGFVAFCNGNVLKYSDRAGLKGDPEGDAEKVRWYATRWLHTFAATVLTPAISAPASYRISGPLTILPAPRRWSQPKPTPAHG